MTPEAALAEIGAHGDATRAEGAKGYHKTDRVFLGTPNPVLNDLTKAWRQTLDLDTRLALADGLWQSDVHEGRIAAAKLLTQARIRPDDEAAWQLIVTWVPDFDSWAIADHTCMAGQKRLVTDPSRLRLVEGWTDSDHLWTKRAALVITVPWAKQNNPKPDEREAREQILAWAATYVADKNWFIQKSVAWWLRDLSKRDARRVSQFLEAHGADMLPFARKEAAKYLA